MSLQSLLSSHADDIDAIAASFERDIQAVIRKASAEVAQQLKNRLDIEGGTVTASAGNQNILASVDSMLEKSMLANGYNEALQKYIDSFNGQYVAFGEVLKQINSELEWPLPQPKFTGPALSELEALKVTQRTLIEGAVQTAATAAKRVALMSVGAVTPKELAQSISEQLHKSIGQAESLADTGISTFYRSISDTGFRMIEEDLPGFKIRYQYDGPLDVLTRPFCTKVQRQSNAGKSWTRAEIDKMDNGQLPNVWLTAGGYRCRHQWIIDTRDLKQQQKKKPKPEPKRVSSSDEVRREVKARRILTRDKLKRAERPSQVVSAARKDIKERVARKRGK